MKRILSLAVLSLMVLHAAAQKIMVSGKVTDDFGEVIGCSVAEIDASNRVVGGTTTNMQGSYVLAVKNVNNKLRFSYVGYQTETREIGSNRKINVHLKDNTIALKGTTITAKKRSSDTTFDIPEREVSMAMTTFDMKEVEGISVTSVDDALQGRIPGLDIVGSGTPGQGGQMRIRGTTTILGNAEPLIVVNDIPFESADASSFQFDAATDEQYADLLNVNVEDIQEITVLKDAASTAMWGSRGANGVIMIKTKKGAMGKTRVTYSYKLTGATQPKGYKLLNGDDFSMMMKQSYFNMNQLTGNSSHNGSYKEQADGGDKKFFQCKPLFQIRRCRYDHGQNQEIAGSDPLYGRSSDAEFFHQSGEGNIHGSFHHYAGEGHDSCGNDGKDQLCINFLF